MARSYYMNFNAACCIKSYQIFKWEIEVSVSYGSAFTL